MRNQPRGRKVTCGIAALVLGVLFVLPCVLGGGFVVASRHMVDIEVGPVALRTMTTITIQGRAARVWSANPPDVSLMAMCPSLNYVPVISIPGGSTEFQLLRCSQGPGVRTFIWQGSTGLLNPTPSPTH